MRNPFGVVARLDRAFAKHERKHPTTMERPTAPGARLIVTDTERDAHAERGKAIRDAMAIGPANMD